MKRDMDLVRRMLLAAEEAPAPVADSVFADAEHPRALVAHNIDIMRQAGLVQATVSSDLSGNSFASIESVTWAGHEFADAVRSDAIWTRTKEKVASTVGSATLDIVKQVAVGYVTSAVLGAM